MDLPDEHACVPDTTTLITRYTDPSALWPGTLLESEDVATILRASVLTLKNWRRDRTGPPWIEVGQQRLYRAGDLANWIEGRVVDPRAEPTRPDER